MRYHLNENPVERIVRQKLSKFRVNSQHLAHKYSVKQARDLADLLKKRGYTYDDVAKYIEYQEKRLGKSRAKIFYASTWMTRISSFATGKRNKPAGLSIEKTNIIGDYIKSFLQETERVEKELLEIKESDVEEKAWC